MIRTLILIAVVSSSFIGNSIAEKAENFVKAELKGGDATIKTISFDGRFIVYTIDGALSYHDKSNIDPTFTIKKTEALAIQFWERVKKL